MPSKTTGTTASFIRAAMGDVLPTNIWAHIWRKDDKRAYWVHSAEQALAALGESGKRDVYFGVGLANQSGEPHERIKATTAAGMLGFLADIDIAGPLHAGSDRPPDQEAAQQLLLELELKPTIVVHSGHGLQAWWLFEKPWIFNGDIDRQHAIRLSEAWQEYIARTALSHGWELDRVGDLPRVFRIPDTVNAKDPAVPVVVQLVDLDDDARYTLAEFRTLCGPGEAKPMFIVGDDGSVTPGAGVDSERRFDRDFPCLICGGHKDMEQGVGERCWGFLSRDKMFAHCVREEFAGPLKRHGTAQTFAHRLYGWCECGQNHGAKDDGTLSAGSAGMAPPAVPPAPPLVSAAGGQPGWNPRYPLDDTGNARRFADKYGSLLRYDHDRARWHHWNGHFWPQAGKAEHQEYAKTIAVDIFREAMATPTDSPTNIERRKALTNWAKSSGMEPHIAKMLKLSTSIPPIGTVTGEWNRGNVQRDGPDAGALLMAFPNRYLNLGTGQWRDPDPADLVTRICGAEFDPDAQSDVWDTTLLRFMPDEEQRIDLQTAVGYCMSGRGKEHMFIAYGKAKRGKSTIVGAIQAAFGMYATTIDMVTLTSTRHAHAGGTREDLMALIGRRLVVASEASESQKLDAATLKMLMGGTDKVSMRGLFGQQIAILPTFAFWLLTNELPKLPADDEAMWERVHVFEFNQYIPKEERDERLRDLVINPAVTGMAILAWGYRGWRRIQDELGGKLVLPTTIAATSGYRSAQDVIAQFIEEQCEEGQSLSCTAAAFKSALHSWLKSEGNREQYNDQRIGRTLGDRKYRQFRDPKTRAKCWGGVAPRIDYGEGMLGIVR